MSLLQQIPFAEYKQIKNALTIEQCEDIAKLANLEISLKNEKTPGESLFKSLDKSGCSLKKFRSYYNIALSNKVVTTYYRPSLKVAILIANEKYTQLSKLITPSIDCDLLATSLKKLGFVIVTVKNVTSKVLKEILAKIFELVPENSYSFIYYAGHGCELCNTKCMLCVDCPPENIQLSHCVTENYLLREVNKSKPDLSIIIMDMCRLSLDRNTNPQIFSSIADIEEYSIHNNAIIAYSTQSSQAAYEVLEMECSRTIDNNITYELQPGDTGKIVPRASQYVHALCSKLADGLDISALLDKVHEDVENSMKKQKPIKVQCGVAKRSLYDPVIGCTDAIQNRLKELAKDYEDHCDVL